MDWGLSKITLDGEVMASSLAKRRKYKTDWARNNDRQLLKENPEQHRKKKSDAEWFRRQGLKESVYVKLGNKCSNPACQWLNSDGTRGCTDKRCLQIDHRLGDGAVDRKSGSQGSNSFLRRVLMDETNRYQLLCANCNWIKRKVNGEDNARNNIC